MNTHSLCCIGYITQDKVVTPKNTIYMPGTVLEVLKGNETPSTLHMPSST